MGGTTVYFLGLLFLWGGEFDMFWSSRKFLAKKSTALMDIFPIGKGFCPAAKSELVLMFLYWKVQRSLQ